MGIIKIDADKVVDAIKYQLKNFFPNKRFNNSDEVVKKMNELFDYIEDIESKREKGEEINPEQIRKTIYEIFGIKADEKEIRNLIDSMRPTIFFDEYSNENMNDYLIFYNNLIEVAYSNGNVNQLKDFLSNIDLPEIMSYYQFLISRNEEIHDSLYRKPFRFTRKSVNEIIDLYGTLSGYYETLVKLMICSYNMVYLNQEISEKDYKKLSKKRFHSILKSTKSIPDFHFFKRHFDRKLRNNIIHKDFKIDYNNKWVEYNSKHIPFKELLVKNRRLYEILTSFSIINLFLLRKRLQAIYLRMME